MSYVLHICVFSLDYGPRPGFERLQCQIEAELIDPLREAVDQPSDFITSRIYDFWSDKPLSLENQAATALLDSLSESVFTVSKIHATRDVEHSEFKRQSLAPDTCFGVTWLFQNICGNLHLDHCVIDEKSTPLPRHVLQRLTRLKGELGAEFLINVMDAELKRVIKQKISW